MLPYVIMHIGVSVDGRIDWGGGADNPYYELVQQFGADTDLSGSNTILKAQWPTDPQTVLGEVYVQWINKPDRSILAIVDSQGRVKNWDNIKKQPWWRGCVALCSTATPQDHLSYLEEQHVDYIITGTQHVDLQQALEELNTRYHCQKVRIDSGGILNGVCLRAGLVDEVSLVISPALVGGTSPQTMFVAPDLASEEGVIPLILTQIETIRDRYLWVRYKVMKQ
jgi:2,5-diamino-6-(ribosylamino)-4(3H)-pyrimidinone 5'-phosphate reductase